MTIDWEHVPAARELDRARIESEARQLAALQARRPARTRVMVIGGTGIGVLALTSAGAAYVAFAPVEDTSLVRCFSDTDLGGPAMYVGMAQAVASGAPVPPGAGVAPQIADPVALCGEMWSQGLIVAGDHSPHDPRPGADLPVPPLTACVVHDTDSGPIVGVVPGGPEVCREMGLAQWQP